MAEIYGSFGRVITGNTLGGSIGSLARQILSDKIRRIFQAYRDETTFEGSLVTAETAVAKLQALLATVGAGSEAANDIKEYIDLIRQEDRTRRVNKAITLLGTQDAATKDYAVLIKTMKDVLSDPTITATEKETLTAAIATQTRNYVNLLLTQYQDGKSVTVDGKVINFDIAANSDSIVSLVEGVIAGNPDMADEFGPTLEISRAFTIIKKAQFDASKISDATDAGKLQSERLMLKAYESAADLMQKSKYDVLQTDEYLKILEYLDTTKGNIATYEKNAAAKVAGEKVQKGDDKIGAVLDQIDKFGAKVLKGSQSDYLSGYKSMKDLMSSRIVTIDELDDYLDAIARNNGGDRSFVGEDGQKISFDTSSMGGHIKDAYNTAMSMVKYANKQDGMKEWANHFKDIAEGMLGFVQNSDVFSVEDKYDAARKKLEQDVDSSNGDIFAIRRAYERFGTTLNTIAGSIGSGSSIYDNLITESKFFTTGNYDEERMDFYGELSGNFPVNTTDGSEWRNFIDSPAQIYAWTDGTDSSALVTYKNVLGDETTMPPAVSGWKDEFGNPYQVPSWDQTGIMAKDERGRNVVNQIVPAYDSKGSKIGFFSIVNGKVVAGKITNNGNSLAFFDTNTINKALSAAGYTAESLKSLLAGGVDAARFNIPANLQTLFSNMTTRVLSIYEVRNGEFTTDKGSGIGGGEDQSATDDRIRNWFKNREYTVSNVPGYGRMVTTTDDDGNVIDIGRVYGEEFLKSTLRLIDTNDLEIKDPTSGITKEVKVASAGVSDSGAGISGWKPRVVAPTPSEPTRSIGSSGYVTTTGPEAKPATPLTQAATTPTTPVSSYLLTQATLPTAPAAGTSPTAPPPPKPYSPPAPPRIATPRDPTGTGFTRDTAWGVGGYLSGTTSKSGGGFFRNSPSKISL